MTVDELIRKELGDGEIYISQLYGDDKHLSIMPSDKYGNDIDNAPYVVDINNGKSIYMKDGLTNFIRIEIPEKYKTYRTRVKEKLNETIDEFRIDDLGPWGLDIVVNTIYVDYIKLELSDIYALCNYLITLITFSCAEEEKASASKLWENKEIREFMQSNEKDKLKASESFYLKPSYIEELFSESIKLLDVATKKDKSGELDKLKYYNIKKNLRKMIRSDLKEKLEKETDEFYNKKVLKKLIKQEMDEIHKEISFCEGRSKEISERMKINKTFDGGFEDFSIPTSICGFEDGNEFIEHEPGDVELPFNEFEHKSTLLGDIGLPFRGPRDIEDENEHQKVGFKIGNTVSFGDAEDITRYIDETENMESKKD